PFTIIAPQVDRPVQRQGNELGLTGFFGAFARHWLTEHQTKNPPVRRVTGANQHHGQKCTIAEGMESRKNSYYRHKAAGTAELSSGLLSS
ncbi:hypothetical protein, partial [Mesorhizobium sp. M7A.F.Ca.ET.027.02.1.1]|uniref:hypothetical protein n=1 Tax=Mesorhizobium sp. M7A.F.Ca.ET.027.02.1.1 TaxID=2496655 RepID=UPI001AEC8799